MDKTLGPTAIGIQGLSLPAAITLAGQTGFTALAFNIREAAALVQQEGLDALRQRFTGAGVKPGCWSVPVAWKNDERWQPDLATLPAFAALGRDLDCPRALTGIMPGSNERAMEENFAWHVTRLRPVAQVLADHGCWLGLEFIGPKTFRDQFRHPFLFTLGDITRLADAIGTGNVGVLLDSWHLYTSGGELADLAALRPEQIVAVHVNDAPLGIPRDEQIDSRRALPLATGVLDLADFMTALKSMGYDGPVMPEPFSAELNEIGAADPEAAARKTAEAMDALWQLAGLE